MRKSITLIALVTFGFLSNVASAEKRTFHNVNIGALELACINVGGSPIPAKEVGGAGCKTKTLEVSCDKKGTCTCTGKCSTSREVGKGRSGLESVLDHSRRIEPVGQPHIVVPDAKGGKWTQ